MGLLGRHIPKKKIAMAGVSQSADASNVYVVVPVHNRIRYTESILACLAIQTYENLKMIIVDDGSTDGTREMVREKYPDTILLQGDGNLWWSGATNEGIKHALTHATDTDFILLLNNDLEVGSTFIEKIVGVAHNNPRSLVGSVVVNIVTPDIIINGGVSINWWTAHRQILNRGQALSQFPEGHYEEASHLTGRGTLIPVTGIQEFGLYDAVHIPHCGDTELPVRASRMGYRLLVSYDCVITNKSEATAAVNVTSSYRLKDARTYFFDLRSYGHIKTRFYFARSANRGKPLRFIGKARFVVKIHIVLAMRNRIPIGHEIITVGPLLLKPGTGGIQFRTVLCPFLFLGILLPRLAAEEICTP